MRLMFLDVFYSNSKKFKLVNKNYKFGEVVYLYINEKIINKLKGKFFRKIAAIYLNNVIIKKDEYIYVLSKNIKRYDLYDFFKLVKNIDRVKITKSYIAQNSIKYLNDESVNSHVAIVSNNISEDIILKYIDRFKNVTIYTDSDIILNSKKPMLLKIEKDTGILVDIVSNSSNTLLCDILVYLEDIHIPGKIKAKKTYVLTENVLDKFSEEYEIYVEYKDKLPNIDNYSKRELASSILYLHNLNRKI